MTGVQNPTATREVAENTRSGASGVGTRLSQDDDRRRADLHAGRYRLAVQVRHRPGHGSDQTKDAEVRPRTTLTSLRVAQRTATPSRSRHTDP